MKRIRRGILGLFASFLTVLLLALPVVVGVVTVVGDPGKVSQAVKDSDLPETTVPLALDQLARENNNPTKQIILNDPAIRAEIIKAFPESYVQTSYDNLINSIYDWLEGRADQPSLKPDLDARINTAIQNLAPKGEEFLQTLPRCPDGLEPNSDNFVQTGNLSCRPDTLDGRSYVNVIVNQIIAGKIERDPGTDQTFTLPTDPQGGSLIDDLSFVPTAYQAFMGFWWVLVVLTLVVMALIALLHTHKYKVPRTLAVSLLTSGLFTAFGVALYYLLLRDNIMQIQNLSTFQQALVDLGHNITDQTVKISLYFAIFYILDGLILLMIYRHLRPSSNRPQPAGVLSAPEAPITPVTQDGVVSAADSVVSPTRDTGTTQETKPENKENT